MAKKVTSRQHRAKVRDRCATIARENGCSGLQSARPYQQLYMKGIISLKLPFSTEHFNCDICSAVELSELPLNVIPIPPAN